MDLQQRVERVERENRRLKLTGLGLLFLVGLVGAWQVGPGQPRQAYAQAKKNADFDTVTAKQILVQDASGKVRLKLEAPNSGPNGDAKLVVLAEDGQEVAGIGQYSKSLAVVWSQRYAGDKPSVSMTSSDDTAGVSAASGGGYVPAGLYASKFGHLIRLTDHEHAKAAAELLLVDKLPAFKMLDKTGATKFLFTFDGNNAPVFRVQEAGVAKPVAISGVPVVSTKHEKGVYQAELKK